MIKFKDARLEKEYNELSQHNLRIKQLLEALNSFVELELKKDIVITSLLRTQAENDKLYVHTPVDKRPPTSPHMSWEAIDLRSFIYTESEIKRMVNFLNQFTYRGGKPVGMFHQIQGGAPHFHIQFAAKV